MSQDSEALLAGILVARPCAGGRPLGDADADEVRRRQTQLMRDYVSRFRGHCERASSEGVLAIFDSVSAATQAAQSLHRKFRARRTPLASCVGAGEIQVSALGCAGQPIQQALDACAQAHEDVCLLTRGAVSLLGTRLPLELADEGPHRRVRWQSRGSMGDALGVPPPVRVHDRQPLVGRQRELDRTEALLAQVVEGSPAWISLTADAGMGKTRLVSELATRARARGFLVLCGVASEDLSLPFKPLVEAMDDWSQHVEDLPLRLGPKAGELSRLLPDLRARVADLPPPRPADPETERQQLFQAVSAWLSDLADEEPVLLIIDSLHWENESTFHLIQSLASGMPGRPIAVVTTARPGNPSCERMLHQVTSVLGRERVHDLTLEGLDAGQIIELFAAAGQSLTPEVASSLQSVTGGLPLHLNEMAKRAAVDSTAMDRTLQQALAQRIEDLSPPVARLIELAAVVGEVFELRDITEVADDPDEAIDALDEALDDGLLHLLDHRHMRYRFVHSMTRDAAYASIRPARLARLHQKVGRAIERRGGSESGSALADLSRHFRKAISLGELERAVRYTRLAADQALTQYANDVALQLYSEALELHDADEDPVLQVELMVGLGRAQRRLGQPDFRAILKQAADLAHRIRSSELAALATIAAYRGSYTRALHVDDDAVQRLRQALALQGEAATVEKARLLSLLAVELTWHSDRTLAVETSREAIEVARALGDPLVLTEVLAHDQWVSFHPLSRRLAVADELRLLAPNHPDPRLRFEIASHDIFTATRINDRARMDRALGESRELAEQLDQPAERSMLLLREATIALMEARYKDVMRLIGQRRELARKIGEADGEAAFRIHQFWLSYETQTAEVGRQVVEALSHDLDEEQKYLTWPTLLIYACDVGLDDLALRLASQLASDGFEAVPRDHMWLCNLSQLAYATARLEQAAWARPLIDRLSSQRTRQSNMVFHTLGATSRYLGLLFGLVGDTDEAEACLREAIAANREMNAQSAMAHCQLDLAELLARQGGDGSQYIQAAARAAGELGMPLIAARARSLGGQSIAS